MAKSRFLLVSFLEGKVTQFSEFGEQVEDEAADSQDAVVVRYAGGAFEQWDPATGHWDPVEVEDGEGA